MSRCCLRCHRLVRKMLGLDKITMCTYIYCTGWEILLYAGLSQVSSLVWSCSPAGLETCGLFINPL